MVERIDLNLLIKPQEIFAQPVLIVMQQLVYIIVSQVKLVFSKVLLMFQPVWTVKKVTIALVETTVLLLALQAISVLKDHQFMIKLHKNLQQDTTIQLVKKRLRHVHMVSSQRMLGTRLVIVVNKVSIVM